MSGFLNIQSVRVPLALALQAHKHLQEVGQQGLEGMALWAGAAEGNIFHVRATIIPEQIGRRTPEGISVAVGGSELHRINVWLYQNQMTLIAQLHSHPGRAYHSDTDDTFPIVATEGGLSLVLPDFAKAPMSLARCATYRYLPPNGWVHLSTAEVLKLITVTE